MTDPDTSSPPCACRIDCFPDPFALATYSTCIFLPGNPSSVVQGEQAASPMAWLCSPTRYHPSHSPPFRKEQTRCWNTKSPPRASTSTAAWRSASRPNWCSSREDAFNPAELLLAALAACILKGIERVSPILHFQFRGLTVKVHGVRQDSPPKMASIEYEILVDSDESDRRLALLHENVQKYGTVFNTLNEGTELTGSLRRTDQ